MARPLPPNPLLVARFLVAGTFFFAASLRLQNLINPDFSLNVRAWCPVLNDSKIVFGILKFYQEVGYILWYVCPINPPTK